MSSPLPPTQWIVGQEYKADHGISPAVSINTSLPIAGSTGSPVVCVGLDFYMWNKYCPSAIVMNLSDGSFWSLRGQDLGIGGTKISLTLSPGEVILSWIFFPRNDGNAGIGGWVITTSLNQKCVVGDTVGVACTGGEVGSGLCVGFALGWAGNEMDILTMTPWFLKPYKAIIMAPLQPIASMDLQRFMNHVNVAESLITNNTTKPQDWTFADSISKATSHEWSNSTAMKFGASVTASAGFLDIVKVEATASWSLTTTQTTTDTITDTLQITWGTSGTIDPGTTLKATAAIWQGVLSLPYSSWATVLFIDPAVPALNFTETGIYKSVQYTSAQVTITDVTLSTSSAAPTATISDHDASRVVPASRAAAKIERAPMVPKSSPMPTTKNSSAVTNGVGPDPADTKLSSAEKGAEKEKEDNTAKELKAIGLAINNLLQSNSVAA